MNDSKFWSTNQKYICVSTIGPEMGPKRPTVNKFVCLSTIGTEQIPKRPKSFIKRLGAFATDQEAKDFVAKYPSEPGYELVTLKIESGKSEQEILAEWLATQHNV